VRGNTGRRRTAAVLTLATVAVAIGAYLAVMHIKPILTGSGCQVKASHAAMALDPEQASVAATIAGVAQRRGLPRRAVVIAYAAGMQESKLHNLGYGDRDSVGVFQQRPSQGWGPARKLRDPVYATTRFFQVLAGIHGYRRMPVYQAAQDVQRSADGYAYIQYQRPAAHLADAFTGAQPHAVWCWSPTASKAAADLADAQHELFKTFGPLGVRLAASPHDSPALLVRPSQPAAGWAVAAWLVTHAYRYHLRDVRYAGFGWHAASGTAGWTPERGSKDTGGAEEVSAS
jgi:hypothetical protein